MRSLRANAGWPIALTQQDLVRDLGQLKLLVLQQGIESQNMKVARLEQELTELQHTDKYANEQAREFNEYLSKSNSDGNAQTEGTKAPICGKKWNPQSPAATITKVLICALRDGEGSLVDVEEAPEIFAGGAHGAG